MLMGGIISPVAAKPSSVAPCPDPPLSESGLNDLGLAYRLLFVTPGERDQLHCPDIYDPRRAQRLLHALVRDNPSHSTALVALGHIAREGLAGPPNQKRAARYFHRAAIALFIRTPGCASSPKDCVDAHFEQRAFRRLTMLFPRSVRQQARHLRAYLRWMDHLRLARPSEMLAEARRFREGRERPRDLYVAAHLTDLAARQHSAAALFARAEGLRSGLYRPFLLTATMWFDYAYAARLGHARAARIVAEHVEGRTPIALDRERAYYYYKLAVRNGADIPDGKLAGLRDNLSPAARERVAWFLGQKNRLYPLGNSSVTWRLHAKSAPANIRMPVFGDGI